MTFSPALFRILSTGLLLVALGCGRGDGPRLATVKGVVTLNGQPLPNATVRFYPLAAGQPYSAGLTDDSGKYVLQYSRTKKGAVVGEHRVTITTGNPNHEDEQGNPAPIPEILPVAYHKESTMTHEVGKRGNQIDFNLEADLTPKKKRK